MAIDRLSQNHDNSPWYDIIEEKALAWQEFANDNNYQSRGEYNAYHVIFKISSIDENVTIKGKRALTRGGFIESLEVIFKMKITEKRNYIKVFRSGILNSLRGKYRNKAIYQELFVTYNNENLLLELKKIGILNLINENILRLRINRKGIRLLLLKLPTDTKMIDDFLNICDRLNKKKF